MSRSCLGPLQQVPLVVVLLFFGGIFYVYFGTNLEWTMCHGESPETTAEGLFRDQTQTSNDLGEMRIEENVEYVENIKNKTKEVDTVVLIWDWPFGHKFKLRSCSLMYNIKGCRLTTNRSQYTNADAVMFHHREIRQRLVDLLKMWRPPKQKWVWMNMESPANSLRLSGPDSIFNLTANYRRDADVWVPYGSIVEMSLDKKPFKMQTKDKLVCWIVNNWDDSFLRVKYFNQLEKHIQIETYGGHFGRSLSYQDYFKTLSSCKFYLSFENSVFRDYVTEKLFNPLISGTVPVVLGPPRENYEQFIPKDSFIHVDDFKSPQELAEHLKALDQNQERYESFFSWRKDFVAKRSDFGLEHACRICDHIRHHKEYRVFTNINKWYWG